MANFKCSGFLSQEINAARASSPIAKDDQTTDTSHVHMETQTSPPTPQDGFVILVTHPLLDFVKIDATTDSIENIITKYTQYYGNGMSLIIWDTPYPIYCKERFFKKFEMTHMENDLFSKSEMGFHYVDILDILCTGQVYTYKV